MTSVQPDHLDFYGTAEAVEAGYRAFVDTLEPGGPLVACLDDPGARRLADLARSQGRRVVGYGFSADAQVRLSDARLGASGPRRPSKSTTRHTRCGCPCPASTTSSTPPGCWPWRSSPSARASRTGLGATRNE